MKRWFPRVNMIDVLENVENGKQNSTNFIMKIEMKVINS